jgi:hypothetical protein
MGIGIECDIALFPAHCIGHRADEFVLGSATLDRDLVLRLFLRVCNTAFLIPGSLLALRLPPVLGTFG